MLRKRIKSHHCQSLSHWKTSLLLTLHYSTFSSASPPSKSVKKGKTLNKYVVYCNTLITKHGFNGEIEESELIFKRMSHKNVISYTSMLTVYAKNGQIGKARQMFDEMPQRNTASYNAMITAYIRNSCMIDEACRLFSQMSEKNAVSYGAMITGFLQAGMFGRAKELYDEMPVEWRDPICSNAMISGLLKAGRLEEAIQTFEFMVERDVVSWSSMIDGYCKRGRIVEARGLFDKMPMRNVITWTGMIDGYMNAGCFEDGFTLFSSMRKERLVAVNPTTLTIMFEACGHFRRYTEGTQVHCLTLQMGFEFDVFLGNSIITMYCRFGCLDEANQIFQVMSQKDVVSWNSLIAGYIQHDEIEEAYRRFQKMPAKDVISWTTMVAGFSAKRKMQEAIQLFNMMPEKDDVAWTAMISSFVSNGEYEAAFCQFNEMLKKAVKPNSLTLSSMLSASAGLATLNQGLQIHAHAVKMDMQYDLSIQNSLISMYSKCGNVVEAYQVFRSINAPNVISFNSMITGFSQNGHGEEAINVFRKMQKESWKPNEITFLGILSACTHVGLVEEGWKYFNLMKSVYNIEPRLDHYACMVDLLGRAGLLDEAIDLIHSMPMEPHAGVWGALLGASRIHFRLDLAKVAAQHLSNLEPDSATPYVVLSDLYNIFGEKKDRDKVRMIKKNKGIKKSPGCSWIITKVNVHL